MVEQPAEVFPLAEYLADEMTTRGWKTEDVVRRMSGKRDFHRSLLCLNLVMCVHSDMLVIDDETFADLACAFDVSEEFLRNLDRTWRENPDLRAPFEPPESIFGPISRGLIRSDA